MRLASLTAIILILITGFCISRIPSEAPYSYYTDKFSFDPVIPGGNTKQQENDAKYKFKKPFYKFPQLSRNSEFPLPYKVEEAFKNVISLDVSFQIEGLGLAQASHGTAFMIKPGIFLSARHVLMEPVKRLRSDLGLFFTIGRNNLPHSKFYGYGFYGTAEINGRPYSFPLKVIAIGDPHKTEMDIMILKADSYPATLKPLVFENNVLLYETVYLSGRIPVPTNIDDLDPSKGSVLIDFISYNFQGTIDAIITDMPGNKTGAKKIYRIVSGIENGFSGGPLLTVDGKVAGMNTSMLRNFAFAISAEDLQLFLRQYKVKNP